MGLPSRGSSRHMTRAQREQRAFRLATTGGIAGAVAVVTGLLAVIGVMGFGLPIVALIVAAVCFVLFRQMVSPKG